MKITVCKEVKYKPSGITSMCSFDDTVIVFRKNNTMEFIRNTTYHSYHHFELPSTVIQCTLLLDRKCLVLGEDNCLRVIDLDSCEVTKLNTEYSIMCFEKNYKPNTLLHCFTRNGMLVSLDLKDIKARLDSKIIKKCSRTITCILTNDIILFGDDKGQISSSNTNGDLLNELEVSNSSITSLLHVMDNKYAALCDSGELIYFDVTLNTILQKIKVREHALNCGLFLNGSLHLTGVDSRLICYKLSNETFQKSYQADKHVLEVTSICNIDDTIFTGGSDGIMGIFIPTETRYTCFRVFDRTPKGKFISKGPNNNIIVINNVDFLEIFELEECLKNINTLDTPYKTTIRLDKKYLEDLSVKGIKFTNQCRICFENKVYCYDIDEKILVYSDNKATRLLSLTPKIEHDEYFISPPSKYICITPELIILHLMDKSIKIIERNDYSIFDQLISKTSDEEIKVINELIVFKGSRQIYNIKDKKEYTLENVDGIIIDVLKINDEIVILTKKDITVHALYRKSPTKDTCFHFATYDILTGIIQHNQDVFYTTMSSITNVKNGSTYDLGSVIYSSGSLGTSLVVVKDDWAYLQNELGEKIVKSKWKTK